MKKSILLWVCLGFILSGCHTIRPLNTPQPSILNEVSRLEKNAGLIMDTEYRTYLSKDRGNPLADPQKYYVGEALAPLTEAYLKQASSGLEVYTSLDEAHASGKNAELYIYPKITQFDNTVRLTEQRIDVTLEAGLYDKKLKLLQTVRGTGMSKGDLGDDVKVTVSTALQLALSQLIREIKNANI